MSNQSNTQIQQRYTGYRWSVKDVLSTQSKEWRAVFVKVDGVEDELPDEFTLSMLQDAVKSPSTYHPNDLALFRQAVKDFPTQDPNAMPERLGPS